MKNMMKGLKINTTILIIQRTFVQLQNFMTFKGKVFISNIKLSINLYSSDKKTQILTDNKNSINRFSPSHMSDRYK